jgi:hypothetical protein
MMLVTAPWKNRKTFRLIPVTPECPFNEMIFDVDERVLAVISKEKKQSLHMLTKLSDTGDPVPVKAGRRANGAQYAEERKTLETYYEYYIDNPEEIREMINMFAVNREQFDYDQYLELAFNVVSIEQ